MPLLEGCIAYNPNAAKQECVSCGDTYFMNESNVCQRGEIFKCATYFKKDFCTKCQAGYKLVFLKNQEQYCMPLNDLNSGCEDTEEGIVSFEFQNNIINCSTCKPKHFLSQISDKKICTQFNLIKYCTKYNRGSNFEDSTLKCMKCREDRFLGSDQVCHSRTVVDDHCLTYFSDQDLCQQCEDEYFLNSTKTVCFLKPSGIQSCRVYSDQNECFLCNSVSYLKDN